MSQSLRWLKRMHLRPVMFEGEVHIAVGDAALGTLWLNQETRCVGITFKQRNTIVPFTDEQVAEEICFKSYIALRREKLRDKHPDVFYAMKENPWIK